MSFSVRIGDRNVGAGYPCYVIAEIGINHNGDLATAEKLIRLAHVAGCDAVKFQKRTPELCVPFEQRNIQRETPWGVMSYMAYRERVEFGEEEYSHIDRLCRDLGIHWFVSPWDREAVNFMEAFEPVCYKIPSASLTDHDLLDYVYAKGRPVIVSTGMSTQCEVDAAVERMDLSRTLLAHTTSTYPCPPAELNLRVIPEMIARYACPIGYSGHEVGLQTTAAAVALGASFVERHITLDRAMWGSDQAASVEPSGLNRLVRDIRVIEEAMGDGIKRVFPGEVAPLKRLRLNK
jgi:N-acetylneuraminate synthase